MDRLDLVDGESYLLRFFYANRSSGRSVFRIRTNIEFDSSGPVSVSAGFD